MLRSFECLNLDFNQQTADHASKLLLHTIIPHHFHTILVCSFLVRLHIPDNITRHFILDTLPLLHTTDYFSLRILAKPRTIRLLVFSGRPSPNPIGAQPLI